MLSGKKSGFILLFSLFSIAAQSQGDFRPGYIIRNNGDSVAGWVDYRNAKHSERVCTFKSSSKSRKEKLTPNDIKAYGIIGDRLYVVKTLRDQNGKSITGFANFLADGAMKLYLFQRTYYVETDSIILLPPTYTKDVTVKGKAYKQTIKPYINILNRLLAPCQLLATHTRYSQLDMTSLVNNYNRCQGDYHPRFVSRKPKTAVSFAVLGGLHADQLSADKIPSDAMKKSVSPYGGARLEVSSPRVYDRVALSLEVFYTKKIYQADFTQQYLVEDYRQDFVINMSMVKIPLGFKYSFFEDHHTPYIRFGYVHTFNSDADVKITTERVIGTSVYTNTEEKTLTSRKSQGGYWGVVGYTYQVRKPFSLFVEFRGERTGGAIDPNLIGYSHHVSFYFTTGIRF